MKVCWVPSAGKPHSDSVLRRTMALEFKHSRQSKTFKTCLMPTGALERSGEGERNAPRVLLASTELGLAATSSSLSSRKRSVRGLVVLHERIMMGEETLTGLTVVVLRVPLMLLEASLAAIG